MPIHAAPAMPIHAAPAMPAPMMSPAPYIPAPIKPGETIKAPIGKVAAPATIIVNLPADAKLTIDGAVTTSTTARRVFTSPELNAGKEYHYNLKAEFVAEGKTVTVSKKVSVTAGNETNVTIEANEAVAAR